MPVDPSSAAPDARRGGALLDQDQSSWCSSDDDDDDDDSQSSLSRPSTASEPETVLTVSEGGQEADGIVVAEGPDPIPGDETADDWESELSCEDSTSLSPSVYEDELAHGRRYHGFRRGRYPLPNDRLEQQCEETTHSMMLELTGGHLYYSDIGPHPDKIIDIGTGIGSWAIDVAAQHPEAKVVGTDLSAIQPRWLPINVRMYVDDCEGPEWLHGSGYDLVHFRGMAGILKDLDGVLQKAYLRTKNGGWVEFQEIIPEILCDDDTMGPDDALRTFYEATAQGLGTFGCDVLRPARLDEALERAGYTKIQRVTHKIPISTWARDKHLKTLGLFMETAMLESLDSLAAKPLAALGISRRDRQQLVRHVEKSLGDRSAHRYVNCVFCYGQKRERAEGGGEGGEDGGYATDGDEL